MCYSSTYMGQKKSPTVKKFTKKKNTNTLLELGSLCYQYINGNIVLFYFYSWICSVFCIPSSITTFANLFFRNLAGTGAWVFLVCFRSFIQDECASRCTCLLAQRLIETLPYENMMQSGIKSVLIVLFLTALAAHHLWP